MTETSHTQQLQAEVVRLQEELQMRDQLVQQLSQELFRLVKTNPAKAAEMEGSSEKHSVELQALRDQLKLVEDQVTFYQTGIAERDTEIHHLRQSATELTDRTRMLEQVVQELPKIYRQKFAERMAPVREKVSQIQRENRQLHAELQSVSYRLAMKNRRSGDLDLPSFSRGGDLNLPSFGNL